MSYFYWEWVMVLYVLISDADLKHIENLNYSIMVVEMKRQMKYILF